jgi:hypothetical protein
MSNLFFVAKKKKSVSKKAKRSPPKSIKKIKKPAKRPSAKKIPTSFKEPSSMITMVDDESLKICREDATRSLERIQSLEKELDSLRKQSEKCLKDAAKCEADLSSCNTRQAKMREGLRVKAGKQAKRSEDADYEGLGLLGKAEDEIREKRRAERKAQKGSYQPPSISPTESGYKALAGDDLFAGLTVKQPSKSNDQEADILGNLFGFKRKSAKKRRSIKRKSKKRSMKKKSIRSRRR